MKRIYLDYAATTPLDETVLKAMLPYFSEKYGNPSSVHAFGQEAQGAVDAARAKVSAALSCLLQEVIFTGSATEANNMAVFGAMRAATRTGRKAHILTSAIEHKSMREPIAAVAKELGADVTYLPVGKDGVVRVEGVAKALRDDTALVSIMYANNEVGSIQPLAEISEIIKTHKKLQASRSMFQALFHTDAAQAANYFSLSVAELGVDMMTLSGHKIYGPKGIGALYLKKGTPLTPLIFGSGQEYGKRSGTENVSHIVGFAVALERAGEEKEKESRRVAELRDYFVAQVLARIPNTSMNGGVKRRLPNNANVLFLGRSAPELILALDLAGVAVSAGSACQSKAISESHVLLALGLSKKDANSSIRFSLGRYTTKDDIDTALAALVKLVR